MRNFKFCRKNWILKFWNSNVIERSVSESLVAMVTTPGWPGQSVLSGYHIKDTARGLYPPGPVWEDGFINDTIVLWGKPFCRKLWRDCHEHLKGETRPQFYTESTRKLQHLSQPRLKNTPFRQHLKISGCLTEKIPPSPDIKWSAPIFCC